MTVKRTKLVVWIRKLQFVGFDGPATSSSNMCTTGIYGVKWLQRNLASGETQLHTSTQP